MRIRISVMILLKVLCPRLTFVGGCREPRRLPLVVGIRLPLFLGALVLDIGLRQAQRVEIGMPEKPKLG